MPPTVKTFGECSVSVSVSAMRIPHDIVIIRLTASEFEVRGPPGALDELPGGPSCKIEHYYMDTERLERNG